MATADEYAQWIIKNADKKGTPEFDIVASAYRDARGAASPAIETKSKPFGEQLNDAISDFPRQVGLTARYGVEGVGDTLDFLSSPIRAGMNAILPKKQSLSGLVTGQGPQEAIPSGSGRYLADKLGLPKPQNGTERVVGDVTRMMAGAAVPIAGAKKVADVTTGTKQAVSSMFAANPLQQIASAGSAGGAGGYVRETGGDEKSQFLASLAGGLTTPFAVNKAQQVGESGKRLISLMGNKLDTPQIDIQITRALQGSGMTLADLPMNVRNSIRQDVQEALRTNGNLSPDAVRRLADYRLTGATPTAGTLTLDPATVSQQKNLAKLGINSKDAAAQQLGQVENANNRQLIIGLNDLGGSTPDTPIAAGRKVMSALDQRNAAVQERINSRYAAARATSGRSAALDPSAFTQRANDLLDEALLGGKLPGDVRTLLNKAASGEMPLTVDVSEQLKTRIGELQRSSSDMAERKALGAVRQALEETPLLQGEGQEAIDAFNRARRLNRTWMGIVENTPALQAVRDGIEPDKFVQNFIVGNAGKANVSDLAALRRAVRSSPEALDAVRSQIVANLKQKALNGSADEVGNFSQSAYNKALNQIGEEKLAMFFQPAEVNQLRAIGRVASYEQFQPKGAAVNNSNTAGAALANILDRVGSSSVLSKIPFGSALAEPAQNIAVGIKAKRSLNTPNALLLPRLMNQRTPGNLLMSPAAFIWQDEQ